MIDHDHLALEALRLYAKGLQLLLNPSQEAPRRHPEAYESVANAMCIAEFTGYQGFPLEDNPFSEVPDLARRWSAGFRRRERVRVRIAASSPAIESTPTTA